MMKRVMTSSWLLRPPTLGTVDTSMWSVSPGTRIVRLRQVECSRSGAWKRSRPAASRCSAVPQLEESWRAVGRQRLGRTRQEGPGRPQMPAARPVRSWPAGSRCREATAAALRSPGCPPCQTGRTDGRSDIWCQGQIDVADVAGHPALDEGLTGDITPTPPAPAYLTGHVPATQAVERDRPSVMVLLPHCAWSYSSSVGGRVRLS